MMTMSGTTYWQNSSFGNWQAKTLSIGNVSFHSWPPLPWVHFAKSSPLSFGLLRVVLEQLSHRLLLIKIVLPVQCSVFKWHWNRPATQGRFFTNLLFRSVLRVAYEKFHVSQGSFYENTISMHNRQTIVYLLFLRKILLLKKRPQRLT